MKLPDEIWNVIQDYLRTRKGYSVIHESLRTIVENETEIVLFDGGAFVSRGNEFDLFVLPERRGRWRIRSTVSEYLNTMLRKHDKLIVRINDDNVESLRLAMFFGFVEVGRNNGVILLEKSHG